VVTAPEAKLTNLMAWSVATNPTGTQSRNTKIHHALEDSGEKQGYPYGGKINRGEEAGSGIPSISKCKPGKRNQQGKKKKGVPEFPEQIDLTTATRTKKPEKKGPS